MAQTLHLLIRYHFKFPHVATFLTYDSQSTEFYFYNWIQHETMHILPGSALLSLPIPMFS
jgi:hypothetical protein